MGKNLMDDIQAPSALKNLNGWIVWRYEKNIKNPKATKLLKVPYYVDGSRRYGENGSPQDRSKLSDFNTAVKAAREHDYTGIGLAMLPDYGITALDFDNCIDDLTGDIVPEVLEAVRNTYTEISPSGKGIRAFVIGNLGDHKSHGENGGYGFELFNNKIFVTFTGDVLFDNEVIAPDKKVLDLIASRFKKEAPPKNTPIHDPVEIPRLSEILKNISPDCCYADWIKVGMAINYETSGSEEGFVLWDSWSAGSSELYATEEFNRSKWDTFGNNSEAKPATVGSLIRMSGKPLTTGIVPGDFEIIPGGPEVKEELTNGYFNIRTTEEFISEVKPLSWMIKGLLPKAELGVIFGNPGAGKSFITLDICASLSRGMDWNCLRINKKHRILYVVAEGANGFTNRLRAYCAQHELEHKDLNIDIISDVTPNLMDVNNVNRLITDILSHGPYDLIVMDTFAQVTPGGNENSGEDMGKALSYCKSISRAAEAMVLLVHHSGKDATKGERGWSGIRGAADVVLSVTRDGDVRKLSVSKAKDDLDGQEYGFMLKSIVVGKDEDGENITSGVVEYSAVQPTTVNEKDNGKIKGHMQRFILQYFDNFEVSGWVPYNNFIQNVLEELPEENRKRSNVVRAITALTPEFIERNETGELRRV